MIYQLTENDYSKISKLGEEYDNHFSKKYLGNQSNILVYEQDSEILGFLITEKTIDEVSIILIYVSQNYRHHGIGSTLIDYLIKNLKDCRRLLLEVSSKNDIAISLYLKKGFMKISTRYNYYKDGSDAFVMEKRLDNE